MVTDGTADEQTVRPKGLSSVAACVSIGYFDRIWKSWVVQMNIPELIADLDRRIGMIGEGVTTLRQEISTIEANTAAFLRVQDLIVWGERSLAELRQQRAKLIGPEDQS